MSFIRQLIERKISSATGSAVTFGDFKFSPLSGAIEVRGVKVAAVAFAVPFVTIDRVLATVSVARALKQEIVVKSLAIEKPVFSYQLRSDGSTNLPPRKPESPE